MPIVARDKMREYGGMIVVAIAQMGIVGGSPKDIALWLSLLARGVVFEQGGQQVGRELADVILQYVYFDSHSNHSLTVEDYGNRVFSNKVK